MPPKTVIPWFWKPKRFEARLASRSACCRLVTFFVCNILCNNILWILVGVNNQHQEEAACFVLEGWPQDMLGRKKIASYLYEIQRLMSSIKALASIVGHHDFHRTCSYSCFHSSFLTYSSKLFRMSAGTSSYAVFSGWPESSQMYGLYALEVNNTRKTHLQCR